MNIIKWENCNPAEKEALLARRSAALVLPALNATVRDIIATVKKAGDKALKNYTALFDKVELNNFALTENDWERIKSLSPRYQQAIAMAYKNIVRIHTLDKPQGFEANCNGIQINKIYKPINPVGLYIPGGTAPLVSTVLMLAIPAKIAGCTDIIMVTPPNSSGSVNPAILYAAQLCGIHSVFRVGGAQGIAALAYGTETIPKVNKIFGPGNAYVMEAKRQVADDPNGAALDMPAGPSEVMVIADEAASPIFVAADLLAQAEHDENAQCILVTPSPVFAELVFNEINRQKITLQRQQQLSQAITNCLIIVTSDVMHCFDIANRYAPEHLIIHLNNPKQWLPYVHSAGSVFLGPWSAEAFGDYASGTNHVLPTAGYAKTYSGLGVGHFMTSITVQEVSEEGFMKLAPCVEVLAELETLDGHERSIFLRRKQLEEVIT